VTALRRFLFDRRLFAAMIIALALVMKIVVPAGFMIGSETSAITIELCSGTGPMTMAMPGTAHHHENSDHQGKEMPCTFAGHAAPALAAADAVLLAIAILFIIATTFRADTPALAHTPTHLRPPLRGPPRSDWGDSKR
jgi:hypothetical protein